MPWSPNPMPELTLPPGLGWSPTGSTELPPEIPTGVSWRPKQQGTATGTSYAVFTAALKVYLEALSAATGVSTGALAAHLTGLTSARTIGGAEGEFVDNTLIVHLIGWSNALAETTARAALAAKGTVDVHAVFTAELAARLTGLTDALVFHTASVLAHLAGFAPGVGTTTAVGQFGAWGPATTSWSTAGTFTYNIPSAALYLDLIAVGSGAGGEGGGLAIAGKGGGAGVFAAIRLLRGVDIPWGLSTLTVTIPAGGIGGAGGGFPARGGDGAPVTIGSYLTAAGGLNYASANSTGLSPGTYSFQGVNYSGGAQQTNQEGNGNAPGGGAAGGRALGFTGTKGGNGAPGGAWIKAGQ